MVAGVLRDLGLFEGGMRHCNIAVGVSYLCV